jgi:hypothetical protein
MASVIAESNAITSMPETAFEESAPLRAGELLGGLEREQMRAEFVAPRPLEMPVVHRQVAVLPEVADDVTKRLIRLEGQALAAVSAAVRVFSVRHIGVRRAFVEACY